MIASGILRVGTVINCLHVLWSLKVSHQIVAFDEIVLFIRTLFLTHPVFLLHHQGYTFLFLPHQCGLPLEVSCVFELERAFFGIVSRSSALVARRTMPFRLTD